MNSRNVNKNLYLKFEFLTPATATFFCLHFNPVLTHT